MSAPPFLAALRHAYAEYHMRKNPMYGKKHGLGSFPRPCFYHYRIASLNA